jgi:hypothetical protein
MPKPDRITFFSVAAGVLLAACSSTSGGPLNLGPYRAPAVVQFSFTEVNPQTVRIPADGNVTWESTAEEARGFVVFPASIASAFRCADLRPYFVKMQSGAYRSLPLTDEESERVQLPCALASGSYDYEIWLVEAGFGDFGDRKPEQVLRANIVVE